MDKLRLVFFLIQLMPFAIINSEAAEANRVLRAVIAEDFAPFYYHDDAGQLKGVSYEVAAHICKKLGYELQLTQLPSMRLLLQALDDGQQHIAINLTATEKRQEVALFTSQPHAYESQNLIVRADNDISFSGDVNSLTNYKIGAIFGWTYGAEFDNANYLQKVYVNNSKQQLKGLLSGRYDLAVNNPQFVKWVATKIGVSKGFRIIRQPVLTLPVTMAVSKQYPDAAELVQEFDKAIADFIKEEAYRNILLRHGFPVIEPDNEE